MTISEITDRVHSLGNAWEQFKQVNDRRLNDIERKGSADPLYMEQLSRINQDLDGCKNRVDALETAQFRPQRETDVSIKENSPYALEYKKAFRNYLRKGMDSGLEELQTKALSVGSDPDGGFMVTPTMSSQMIKLIQETSPLRHLASIETISSDSLEIIEDSGSAVSGWTTETGTVSDTDTPLIGKKVIAVHELYAQPKATQKLVDDAAIDIENWIAEKVAVSFSRQESDAFINGDGTTKPKGILTYPAGTSWGQIQQVNSGINAAVTADSLLKLYYSLHEHYAGRGTFLMNRSVLLQARLLKESTTNQYMWQPGLAAGTPDTLLGAPVTTANDLPGIVANGLSVVFADFASAYTIVDRMGIRTLRDPYTNKPFIKFYTTKRVGGDVVNFEAIKILKLAV